ncbi:DUF6415 family natural product biosynthesis protein [Streptomyces lydicus]|uniref:DUF6415 family natural product biosynthesis protein n=1 Tax=Streptomyces lydicus TaxID=47763 RepID=UPI0010117BF4|nr:DUF6415 family natural product biosynthesis protein [Streptomyces lydicus]MCZ1006314.1 DUF6415 family natural product biosynthesis protein [Streptomyces lydicus]
MTATAGAPSRDEIQETVDRALQPGPPPPYDELVALEQTLLLIIADLYATVAEQQLDARMQGNLTAIRYQTAVGLGDGLVSAHQQVRALARGCQWLLKQRATGARR